MSLVLAGVTNGLSQYLTEVFTGGHDSFSDQIRWGADNPGVHQAEQFALVVSMLFLPIGLLGLAQVSRWRAPRLTAVGLALVAWGMWGFHNVRRHGLHRGFGRPRRDRCGPGRQRSTTALSSTPARWWRPCCRTWSGPSSG